MSKILLVGINARYTHTNLALRYIRNLNPTGRFQTELIEFSINQDLLEILRRIVLGKPDVIAFSVYIWNSSLVKKLLPDLKQLLPDSTIVLGGPEVSYNAEKWLLELPQISYIVCGAGESGWKFLLNNNFNCAENIIKIAPLDISTIPFPYQEDEFDLLEHRYIYYEASRGCPFKCSYCLSSRSDQKLQYREIELVKEELNYLCSKGVKIVKFVDRSFNARVEYARGIWRYLSSLETRTRFHFEIQPDLLQEEDLDILSQAPKDRFQLEIGIQSVNPQVLKTIGRCSNWSEIKVNLNSLCKLSNLHVHVDLITGLPYADENSLQGSFNAVYKLQADHFQLGFLKVLPGTEMAERSEDYEILHTSEAPYEVLKTKWLSFTEIDHFRQISQLLDSLYNTGHFITTLQELIREFSSPLQFYETFTEWLDEQNEPDVTRKWQKNGALLLPFIVSKIPERKEYLLDCLRWDWCRFAASHYYPDFLQNKILHEVKNYGRSQIRENFKAEFPQPDLNRAIFFTTDNLQFRQKFLGENQTAVFLKGKLRLTF